MAALLASPGNPTFARLALRAALHQYGIAPNWREIAEGTDIRAKVTLDRVLDALDEQGFIRRHPRTARGIALK